ncbi:class F sortase [Prauserella oleivorans]
MTTQASSPPPPTETGTPASLAASEPVWLEIPAIDVRTDEIIDLGLQPNGELEVPDDAVTAGWYTKSPTPGEVGPSVIAGHVDYDGVAGVFFRLHELSPGDTATVHRDDGSAVEFTITRVEQYGKDAFPTEQVYGNTDGPELRLITCGGDFDRDSGEYLDNVVAYATMTGVRQG